MTATLTRSAIEQFCDGATFQAEGLAFLARYETVRAGRDTYGTELVVLRDADGALWGFEYYTGNGGYPVDQPWDGDPDERVELGVVVEKQIVKTVYQFEG